MLQENDRIGGLGIKLRPLFWDFVGALNPRAHVGALTALV
jgi:hypothetical protein